MGCSCSCSGICTESFKVEKNFKTIRPDHYPQQCQVHYFTSFSLFIPGIPLIFPSATKIEAEFLYLKLVTDFSPHNSDWTTEGTSLSSWVAGVSGWTNPWQAAGSVLGKQCEECDKAMNTLCSKHWWVSPPFLCPEPVVQWTVTGKVLKSFMF